MCVHEPQPAEASLPGARAADVGEDEAAGIAHHHPLDLPFPRQQHSELAVQLGTELGEVAGQLGADQLVGPDPATVGRLEPVNLVLLEPESVAEQVADALTSSIIV